MTQRHHCQPFYPLAKRIPTRALRLLLAAPTVLAFFLTPAKASITPQQTQSAAPQQESKPVLLEPGKPLERELKGGEKHTYEIRAEAGQFLHAEVEQLGIDVALTLYAPDGKPIASMDSPNGNFGPEKISTIAEAPGTYRLEVASGDAGVPAGRYRATVVPPRTPSDQDRARISAEPLLAEAVRLQRQGSADSMRLGLQKYEDAVSFWHTAGDRYEEALTLTSAGDIYENLGENQKALDRLNQALVLWHALGDLDGEGGTLNDLGSVYAHLGNPHKAIEYFQQALPLAQAAGNPEGEASILSNMGYMYSVLGDQQKALEYHSRALPLDRSAGDRAGEAITLNNIGIIYQALGENLQALDFYGRSLGLEKAVGDRTTEAHTLTNIGQAYKALGEFQKALSYYSQALGLERTVGDRAGEAAVLYGIGAVYAELHANQKALEYYGQALSLQRAVGDRQDEAATLHSIGTVYFAQGERLKALDYYGQSLNLARAVGDRMEEAEGLHSMGTVYTVLGEQRKALDYYSQSLPILRAIGYRAGEAIALSNAGHAYAALGDRESALQNFTQGLVLARQIKDALTEASVLSSLMGFWQVEGKIAPAIFFGKQAVNEFQQIRASIKSLEKETQQSFLKSKEKVYRDLADLLIAQGRLPEAQQVLDLLKNEEFFEFIRRDGDAASSLTAPVTLTKEEESLSVEYEKNVAPATAIGNEYAALHSKPQRTAEEERHLNELSEQLKAATEKFDKFLNGLHEEMGKTREAQAKIEEVNERTFGMQRVVTKLGRGTVAMYTLVGDEKYRVIVVTPTVMVAREYPIKAEELRKKVFEFRETLTDPRSNPLPKARELYGILIGPVEKDLEGAKAETLMWSLDDVLRYLPMGALHDGHGYLLEKYRNTVFTPASVDSLTEHSNVSAWQGLGMGVSKSYGGFSALPSVPEELHRIIREKNAEAGVGVLPGQVMLDETFTAENMKKALEQNFSLVHIASHFDFAAGNETGSFLLLGGKDQQGGHLTLGEIRKDRRFDFTGTELLTLSACNTGVSAAEGDGREVDGLGYVAQQKGARAVVASLWGVYDSSTGVLMEEFYKTWTTHPDISKAEALRRAQLSLLHGPPEPSGTVAKAPYAHPYYWAPFILIGNWQ